MWHPSSTVTLLLSVRSSSIDVLDEAGDEPPNLQLRVFIEGPRAQGRSVPGDDRVSRIPGVPLHQQDHRLEQRPLLRPSMGVPQPELVEHNLRAERMRPTLGKGPNGRV